jgi:hypothetical protein
VRDSLVYAQDDTRGGKSGTDVSVLGNCLNLSSHANHVGSERDVFA